MGRARTVGLDGVARGVGRDTVGRARVAELGARARDEMDGLFRISPGSERPAAGRLEGERLADGRADVRPGTVDRVAPTRERAVGGRLVTVPPLVGTRLRRLVEGRRSSEGRERVLGGVALRVVVPLLPVPGRAAPLRGGVEGVLRVAGQLARAAGVRAEVAPRVGRVEDAEGRRDGVALDGAARDGTAAEGRRGVAVRVGAARVGVGAAPAGLRVGVADPPPLATPGSLYWAVRLGTGGAERTRTTGDQPSPGPRRTTVYRGRFLSGTVKTTRSPE